MFSQTDEVQVFPRIPPVANMASDNVVNKEMKIPGTLSHPIQLIAQMRSASRDLVMIDENFDEEDNYHIPELGSEK